jgi:hypothetical protein
MAIYTSDLELVTQVDEKPGENKLDGNGLLMFDSAENLYASDFVFNKSFKRLSDSGWNAIWRLGYFDPGTATFTFPFVDFVPSDSGKAEQWSDPTSGPVGILGPISISGGQYTYDSFSFLYHDSRRNLVALYMEPKDTPERHIQGIIGSDNDFFGSLADPIDSDTRFFEIIPFYQHFDQPFFVENGTVVRYRTDNRFDRLVRYDENGIELSTYLLRDRGDIRMAFSSSGEYWYILKPEESILAKVRTWW